MKRQGLNVSINELRKIADELEKETKEFGIEVGVDAVMSFDRKWLINIINKKPNCSDTWEIEEMNCEGESWLSGECVKLEKDGGKKK